MNRCFSIYIMLLLCVTRLHAQDLTKDLAAMAVRLQQAETFGFEVEVKIFPAAKGTPFIQKGKLYKHKGFYYEIGGAKMVVATNYLLLVNDQDKNIVYKPLESDDYTSCLVDMSSANLDSAIANYDSVTCSTEGGQKHYTVYTGKRLIEKTELYMDSGTRLISKVIYHYNRQLNKEYHRVEITFTHHSSLSVEQKQLVSPSTYIQVEGKKVKPYSAYSNYQLLIVANHEN